jgi:hypothetical protein
VVSLYPDGNMIMQLARKNELFAVLKTVCRDGEMRL